MTFQGGSGSGQWRFLLPGTEYDYELSAGDTWRNTAVAACLGWIENNFSEPILEAVREARAVKGKKSKQVDVVTDHPCVKLLERPNRYFDRWTFWSAIALSYVVDGNAYIRKLRARAGNVVELWWLPHWMIWPKWNPDGSTFLDYYEYQVNGHLEWIHPDDIVHLKWGTDPRDDRKGWSKLKQAVRQICGLNECDGYTASILRNMGVPGAVISVQDPGKDAGFTQDELPVLKDQWREMFTSEGRGSPLFIPRLVKVEKIAFTPEELRLENIPDRLEASVCAVIGLNPMVLGLAAGAKQKTYANYGESRRAAYEDCLIPMQKRMAEGMTQQLLLPDFSDADRLRWDYAGVQCLQENATEQATRVSTLYQQGQVITRAEAREMVGFDWTAEDEVYFSEASFRTEDEEDIEPEEDREGGPNELGDGSATTKVSGGADAEPVPGDDEEDDEDEAFRVHPVHPGLQTRIWLGDPGTSLDIMTERELVALESDLGIAGG